GMPSRRDLDLMSRMTQLARIAFERHEAEEALRASERRFRGLFDNVVEGVYQVTLEGRLLSANRALVEMLGFESLEELRAAGLTPAMYVDPANRGRLVDRLLVEGELLARCSVAMAPPRPEAKPMTLAEFERDVLKALETQAGKVAAATEWTTPAGYQCLGVFVDGSVSGGAELAGKVEVQWRYFHLSAPGRPQATVAVTVERGYLERFADADRPLVDSFELVAAAKTAAASAATSPK
ncbi:MAG TPA: PAS domain-containing protein, partial [Lacipirellulaceae bacterium]|nr:PAS domain-containing protein [Lacipirellulaceae bacterium]